MSGYYHRKGVLMSFDGTCNLDALAAVSFPRPAVDHSHFETGMPWPEIERCSIPFVLTGCVHLRQERATVPRRSP